MRTGRIRQYIAKKYRHSVFGIDPAEQIGIAKKLYSEPNKIEFHLGQAEKIPFPDQHFDLIVSIEVFCHVLDLRHAFQECLRVLRPGGH